MRIIIPPQTMLNKMPHQTKYTLTTDIFSRTLGCGDEPLPSGTPRDREPQILDDKHDKNCKKGYGVTIHAFRIDGRE